MIEIILSFSHTHLFITGELDTYAVASCLINSFHLIVQEKKDDAYLINCFTNTLMVSFVHSDPVLFPNTVIFPVPINVT